MPWFLLVVVKKANGEVDDYEDEEEDRLHLVTQISKNPRENYPNRVNCSHWTYGNKKYITDTNEGKLQRKVVLDTMHVDICKSNTRKIPERLDVGCEEGVNGYS